MSESLPDELILFATPADPVGHELKRHWGLPHAVAGAELAEEYLAGQDPGDLRARIRKLGTPNNLHARIRPLIAAGLVDSRRRKGLVFGGIEEFWQPDTEAASARAQRFGVSLVASGPPPLRDAVLAALISSADLSGWVFAKPDGPLAQRAARLASGEEPTAHWIPRLADEVAYWTRRDRDD